MITRSLTTPWPWALQHPATTVSWADDGRYNFKTTSNGNWPWDAGRAAWVWTAVDLYCLKNVDGEGEERGWTAQVKFQAGKVQRRGVRRKHRFSCNEDTIIIRTDGNRTEVGWKAGEHEGSEIKIKDCSYLS